MLMHSVTIIHLLPPSPRQFPSDIEDHRQPPEVDRNHETLEPAGPATAATGIDAEHEHGDDKSEMEQTN